MATAAVSSTGIDVNSIVSQLMTIEQRPLALLTQKETALTTRIAAFSRVQGAVSALQSTAAALAKGSTYTGLRASAAGDGAVAAVTDTAAAAVGTYEIKVTALAATHALASQAMPATDAVGTGTLTIELGSVSGGLFTAKGGSTAVPITIDSSNDTLAGIRDAINAAKLGVAASLVTDNGGTRLTLVAADTGAANTIRVAVADASDASNTDAAGLSRLAFDPTVVLAQGQTTAAGRQLLQSRAATDAAFEINGLALTASGNKVSGAIQGVSLDLKKAAADTVTTVTVARDSATIKAAVDSFIKAYNDVDKVIRELTAYDAASKKAATLNGDSSMRSLQAQMRLLVAGRMQAADGDHANLSAIGIEMGRDGTLSLNATRFETAAADPAKLSRLFATTADVEGQRGFAVRFEALAKGIAGTDGMLPARNKSLQAQIDAFKKQGERLSDRLTQIEARLRKQYSALDVQLQRAQGTSDSLANALRKLPGSGDG